MSLRLLTAALLAIAVSTPVSAQSYPNRPIKLVVPFTPGGPTDVPARMVAQKVSGLLGQQVYVENRPGAGGSVGAKAVAKGEADGYTLLYGSTGSLAISPAMSSNVDYDAVKSFVPIALVSSVPYVMIVGGNVPINSLSELVAHAKANPGKVNFGAPTGTPPHMLAHLFKAAAGVDINVVTYRGAGPVMTDLLAGQIQATFETTSVLLGHISDKKVRPLAAATAARIPALPDLSTTTEQGVPKLIANSWGGILAPAGTPPDVVAKLSAAFNEALSSPDLKAELVRTGSVAQVISPQEFGTFIKDEAAKWRELVQMSGVSLN